MRVLVLNQDWFVRDLREMGHEVLTCGPGHHMDLRLQGPVLHIDTLLKTIEPNFKPDVLLVLDNSCPIGFAGLDELQIPAIFYSVDTHHHASLHKLVSFVFDKTLIAQPDYKGEFDSVGAEVEWMPLWASRRVEASTEKKHGAVFVGTLNPNLNPDRVAFFDALQKEVPILCTSGDWATIFPFSELVINQTVKGDVNFRVFESMMCGPLLLTERSGNGLFEIFKDNEHLITYEKGNVKEAARKIEAALANMSATRRMAEAGRAEILAKHTESHRAKRIDEILRTTKRTPSKWRHFGAMANLVSLGRQYATLSEKLAAQAFGLALKSADLGLKAGEPLTEELSFYLVFAALRYDAIVNTQLGDRLLASMHEAQRELMFLNMAMMRNHLNAGRRDLAMQLAGKYPEVDQQQLFIQAEDVIQQLLKSY
jgi:hypothetical protein